MKKRVYVPMILAGILAILVVPVLIQAAGCPRGDHSSPRVPPCFTEKYDADKDGKLSATEEKAAQEAFMKLYDKNKDGSLSSEERQAARVDLRKAAFDRMDKNKDGVLSREEHESAWQDRPKGFCGQGGGGFMGRGQRPCE